MPVTLTVRYPQGPGGIRERDVRLRVSPGTPLRAFCEHLTAAVGAPTGTPLWSGRRLLEPDDALGDPRLRTGTVLTAGCPEGEADTTTGGLAVVGGPDAGAVIGLRSAPLTVGRGEDCDVVLGDPATSRRHLEVQAEHGRIRCRDLGSTNGSWLDGERLGQTWTDLSEADVLRIGDTALAVAPRPVRVATGLTPDGRRELVRAARPVADLAPREFVQPPDPEQSPLSPLPWLAAVLPAAAGGGIAWLTGNLTYLAFALMSPVVLLGQGMTDRLSGRRTRRHRRRAAATEQAAVRAAVDRALRSEAAALRSAYPDPVSVAMTAELPTSSLWARGREDPDALVVRLGLGRLPSAHTVRAASGSRSAGVLSDVPVTVNLADGPLCLLGPQRAVDAVARWVIAQLAVALPPADLRLVPVLADRPAWRWLRWLPQVSVPPRPFRSVEDEVTACAAEHGSLRSDDRPGRWTVLLLDAETAAHPAVRRLLDERRPHVTAVILGSPGTPPAPGTAATAVVTGETGSRLSVNPLTAGATSAAAEAVSDQVSVRWADALGRALAGTGTADDSHARLADEARLLDLLDLRDPTPDDILRRWAQGHRTAVPLAVAPGGPVEVDLAADGPHALIAGTTGAGKSELLQTLVAGLAATQPPSALTFVLIDYKGGAAFADCADFPHTVAVVTDLDRHLTRRALQSLDAELRRRERVLAGARVGHIDDLPPSPPGRRALARLVLVVDEFAALAQELPDFLSGLVGIAQRGRSLGVHLVLATQRPSGSVSADIRANTSLRICLRVTDPAESIEVVGSDAASRMASAGPGRAVFRLAGDLIEAQTARVTAPAVPSADDVEVELLDEWGRGPAAPVLPVGCKTDLALLVAATREAALRSGSEVPSSPWLPPLGPALPIAVDRDHRVGLVVGLADLPEHQRQEPVRFRPAGDSLLISGGPGGGRHVRAIAAATAHVLGPAGLHLYVLDFGGGMLAPLADLPHCAAYLTAADYPTVPAVLDRLVDRETLRDGTGAAVLLAIDGWDALAAVSDEVDAGRTVDLVCALITRAAAAGLGVLVSGDRGTLTGRLPRLMRQKLVLELADPAEYALAGIPARAVPDALPPGRALLWGSGVQVQLGCLGDDPSDAGQAAAIGGIIEAAERYPVPHPRRIRPLPASAPLSSLTGSRPDRRSVVLGVAGPYAEPLAVDLATPGLRLLVAGPPRTGRTTALQVVLAQVADPTGVLVVAPARSPLARTAVARGVGVVDPQAAGEAADGLPPDGLLLVDDAERLTDTVLGERLTDLVRRHQDELRVVLTARTDDAAVAYRGLLSEVRRARAGVLLAPAPADGDILGLRLPRTREPATPGRGVAALAGVTTSGPADEPVTIQLAVPDGAESSG